MPRDQFENFYHPVSGLRMNGRRLQPGDVIEPTDVYSSTNGTWELAPCPGVTLQASPSGDPWDSEARSEGRVSTTPVWVRPR